jgi:putative toxin-antitoxin system antitoxin component (TIGR02293 family)
MSVTAGLAAPGVAHRSARRALRDEQEVAWYRASAIERASTVKKGVPASYVVSLINRMAMAKEKFYGTLGLARATVDRKVRERKLLNPDESERVVGFARLVGQAHSLVHESGGPENFDAARWLAAWLDRPLPALGGKCPGEFLDTVDGRALVADLLAQQQSGAYA